jgi:hypothetical protein
VDFPVESKVSYADLAQSKDFLARSTFVHQFLTLVLRRDSELSEEFSILG